MLDPFDLLCTKDKLWLVNLGYLHVRPVGFMLENTSDEDLQYEETSLSFQTRSEEHTAVNMYWRLS